LPGASSRRKPSTNKEADVEETIGYEALFSREEWDSLDLYDGEELEFSDASPNGDAVEGSHACVIYDPPGELAGNETRFEIECDRCGTIGGTDTETEAKAIARLHEAFVATLVETWSVDR
jgi:hypothetical protein